MSYLPLFEEDRHTDLLQVDSQVSRVEIIQGRPVINKEDGYQVSYLPLFEDRHIDLKQKSTHKSRESGDMSVQKKKHGPLQIDPRKLFPRKKCIYQSNNNNDFIFTLLNKVNIEGFWLPNSI